MNYIWVDNVVTDAEWLCMEVQKRLQMQYIQEWIAVVQDTSKCINYHIIFCIKIQNGIYITDIQPKFYVPIARYRTANDRLLLERGSWNDTPRSQRVWTLCNRNELGDEFHYLFECGFFKKLEECIYRNFTINMFPYWGLGKIDGLLVPPGQASNLLTDHLITG